MNKIKKIGNLLLVDYNNIMYKAIFANLRLTYKGSFTGGVYGFIKQLIFSCNKNNINKIVVCKDSAPYIRKQILPDYKGDRKEKDEEFLLRLSQSKKFIDEFLSICNIQIDEFQGYEADDIIAQYCLKYCLSVNKIIIKSNDDDLFQLLKKNIVLDRGKENYYTLDDFTKEYSIPTCKWIDVIALKGSHNNVKGINKVGIKTALKIVKDQDLFDKYYADYEQLINLNRSVIKLPYDKLNIKLLDNKKIDFKNLRMFLSNLGIRITIDEINMSFKGI